MKHLYQLCHTLQSDAANESMDSNYPVSARDGCASEDGDNKFRLLEPMIVHYFTEVNSCIQSSNFYLLDRLGGRADSDSGVKAYRYLQTSKSVKEYSCLFTQLVILLLNLSVQRKEALSKLGVTLTAALTETVYKIYILF